MFDMFVFDDPQNYYYLCYMSLIIHQIPLEKSCDNFSVACQPCDSNTGQNLSSGIFNNLQKPFLKGRLKTQYWCFTNCTSLSLSIISLEMSKIENSAGVIVIDNTNYPKGGAQGNNMLEFTSSYSIEVGVFYSDYCPPPRL